MGDWREEVEEIAAAYEAHKRAQERAREEAIRREEDVLRGFELLERARSAPTLEGQLKLF